MRTTRVLFDQRTQLRGKRFIDSLRVYVKGGTGGQGLSRYGGVGGKGGDVWLEAERGAEMSQSLKTLWKANPSQRWEGAPGGHSAKMAIQGKSGASVKFKVPLGVVVSDDETKEPIGEINTYKDKLLLAQGGDGGHAKNQFLAQKGQARFVRLDLKILADVGLVGFPNAGKSTLLAAVSRATPRIAAFPFTTIRPELGIMEYEDRRQITMADLPGLIEGAHKNVGLGHRFLRHVERTRLLLFVIDVDGFQLGPEHPYRTAFQTLVLLNKELELYKESLTDKPAMLAINKMDKEGAERKCEEFIDQVKHYAELTAELPEEMRPTHPISFDDIIPMSGLKHTNVDRVKERVREMIDNHADKELDKQQNHKDLMRELTPMAERSAALA